MTGEWEPLLAVVEDSGGGVLPVAERGAVVRYTLTVLTQCTVAAAEWPATRVSGQWQGGVPEYSTVADVLR